MSCDIHSIQRRFPATRRTPVVSCAALTARGGSNRVRHQRCVGCDGESGSAVEPGLGDGEENVQGPAFMDRREGCLRQAVVRPRRAGDGWPDGNRVDAQRLAIMVSSVDRSSLLSRTVGAVMPSHSGAASPEWGKLSQRSSPWATARTPSAHAGRAQGLAVHLAELNC